MFLVVQRTPVVNVTLLAETLVLLAGLHPVDSALRQVPEGRARAPAAGDGAGARARWCSGPCSGNRPARIAEPVRGHQCRPEAAVQAGQSGSGGAVKCWKRARPAGRGRGISSSTRQSSGSTPTSTPPETQAINAGWILIFRASLRRPVDGADGARGSQSADPSLACR
ncbi:hypothetical protein ACRAWD_12545 [Caulobacter segnis]